MTESAGYIYIGYRGHDTKIGFTSNPKRRFKDHRRDWAGMSIGFSFVFQTDTYENARKVETRAKAILKKHSLFRSEWYRVTNEVALQAIFDAADDRAVELKWRSVRDFINNPMAEEAALLRDDEEPAYEMFRLQEFYRNLRESRRKHIRAEK